MNETSRHAVTGMMVSGESITSSLRSLVIVVQEDFLLHVLCIYIHIYIYTSLDTHTHLMEPLSEVSQSRNVFKAGGPM